MRGWRKDWGLDWGMVNWGYGGGRGWFRRQSQMIRQKKLSDKK